MIHGYQAESLAANGLSVALIGMAHLDKISVCSVHVAAIPLCIPGGPSSKVSRPGHKAPEKLFRMVNLALLPGHRCSACKVPCMIDSQVSPARLSFLSPQPQLQAADELKHLNKFPISFDHIGQGPHANID